MTESEPWLGLRNGTSIALDQIPRHGIGTFSEMILTAVEAGDRVSALFGWPTTGDNHELMAVVASDVDAELHLAIGQVDGNSFPSLTPDCPQVHLFEREIAENLGLDPVGHPWLKPVRFPGSEVGTKAGQTVDPKAQTNLVGVMDYYRVDGNEVHEVAVGPVHAGVIEPGHFRFQCHGEQVQHLEISLGYQHRGVERALAAGDPRRRPHYVETLAGDTSIGHAMAYAQAIEALALVSATPRADVIRGIALELERLANHTGDLGALAGDVGFLPTASFCGRLRGEWLNLTAELCGSRFGRNLVRPGGVGFDVDQDLAQRMRARVKETSKAVGEAVELLWSSPSVMSRFEDTGRVRQADAIAIGLVGPAARASGLRRDVRSDHPTGVYRFAHVARASAESGDVYARAFLRWVEIQRSAAFLIEELTRLPAGEIRRSCDEDLLPEHVAVSLVEGWRGEICHIVRTDEAGTIAGYKVVDPSFHNWMGLSLALRGEAISDFPICNKSFNLSYAGFDL